MKIPRNIKRLIKTDPKAALALASYISEVSNKAIGPELTLKEFKANAMIMAREHYIGKRLESFYIVCSDQFGKDIRTYVGIEGSPSGCGLPLREFLSFILESACSWVVIFHNHPSLSQDPSSVDLALKEKLQGIVSHISVVAHYAIVTADAITFY